MADSAPVHYERHRPEQATLYRLVQQHAASFVAHIVAPAPDTSIPDRGRVTKGSLLWVHALSPAKLPVA